MMFDLKGSTRLAHALTNQLFHEEVSAFKDVVVDSLKSSNWILQQYVWDAFEFTLTSNEALKEKIDAVHWHHKILPLFEAWKDRMISKYGDLPEINSLSYRICFTYGDTSRGVVVEGATRKWAFTGNAIAVVSKVEQESKKLVGQLFCDANMINRTHNEWQELCVTNQGLTVYGLLNATALKKAA